MSYSITSILHPYEDRAGLHKVLIQIIYHRMKVYQPTIIKVKGDEFSSGTVIKHRQKKYYNDILSEKKHEIEKKLLTAIRQKEFLSKKELEETIKGKVSTGKLSEYIESLQVKLKGKLSEGRLRHYKVMENKVFEFAPDISFKTISVTWMNDFETWLRSKKLDNNTILANMSLLIAVLKRAEVEGLVDHKQFAGYKRISYQQKLVEYLSEAEIEKIKTFTDLIEKKGHKTAGYYFLLSCFTGYRIGDARRFNYSEMVRDGQVVLRAAKNGRIVSIPVYSKLAEILEFVKDRPLNISDQKVNEYLKDIALYCGIKKNLHFHMARHSFAMMLMSKGLSIDEVAVMLGDSRQVAQVYAHISNPHLSKKIMDKLG